jgi:hypothetical protein
MTYRLKGASGAFTGQTFDLGESLTLGSAPECDVRLDGLEPGHAAIERSDGGLVLRATGEGRVNGEPVQPGRNRALQSGDELQFGTHRFVLQAPGLKPARVLDQVPERRAGGWKWWAAAGALAAAGAAAWWIWMGPGAAA